MEPPGAARVWTIAIAATMAVAAALRFAGLDSSLWYDEIMTLVISARLPVREIVTVYPDTNVHPLYSLLAHASLATFGESAWALRLPAALFGIGSVGMAYVLGARLMPRAAAWAGATVLAVSYHHIWFSQNARGYTLMGFMALASTWLLLRAGETGRRRDYVFYALACAAGVYAHLTMALVAIGQAAAVLAARVLRWPRAERVPIGPAALAWAGAAALSVAAYAPYMPDLLSNLAGDDAPRQAAQVATAGWALGEAARSLLAGSGAMAALAGLIVAGAGVLSLWRRHPLATALLVAPAVVTLAAIVVLGQPMRPRFFFFMSGAAAIFVGRGIAAFVEAVAPARLAARPGGLTAAIVAGALALAAASAPSLPRNYRVPKQDFEGVVSYLESAEGAGARVAIADPACLPFERYYRKAWACLDDASDWPEASAGQARVLVAYTLVDYVADPALRERLDTRCPIERRFPGTLGGGDFTVCEARP